MFAFCLPCSSAIRTVNGWLPPSGITLFKAEIASCASSRLLNLLWQLKILRLKKGFQMSMQFEIDFYLTKATPRGLPLILSFKIFFWTMVPYLPKIVSIRSSFTVRGKFVTYKFVSLISSLEGRAYETYSQIKYTFR